MIKAIIFDMNGVIIDDEPLHYLAFKKVCRDYGISLSWQNYLKLCLGRTDAEGWRRIIKEQNLPEKNIKWLVTKKTRQYFMLIPKKIKAVPGVISLIKHLSHSFKLAISSGASRREVNMVLKHFKVRRYFKIIISAENIKHSKPHPEPYLLTAKKLKLLPKECIVFEDAPAGIQSAKKAGMSCIAVTSTYKKTDLKQAGLVVNNFSEVNERVIQKIGEKKSTHEAYGKKHVVIVLRDKKGAAAFTTPH